MTGTQSLFGRRNQQIVSIEQDFSDPMGATLKPGQRAQNCPLSGVKQRTVGSGEAVGRRDVSSVRAALTLRC
jgi:hypothetical protein